MQKKTRRSLPEAGRRGVAARPAELSPAALDRKAREFLRLSREVREAATALGTSTKSTGHPAAAYFADLHPRLRGLLLCASRVKRGFRSHRPPVGPDGLDFILRVGGSLLHQVELSRLATALDSGRRRSRASSFGLEAFLREAVREGPFQGRSPIELRLAAGVASRKVRGDRACLKRLLLYLLGRAVSEGARHPVVLDARPHGSGVVLGIEAGKRAADDAHAPDAGYAAARRLAWLLRTELEVTRKGRRRSIRLHLPAGRG